MAQMARIPKGTKLRSMHPQRDGDYEAGRDYTVKVHSVDADDHWIRAGWLKDDGTISWQMNNRDLYYQCKNRGIKYYGNQEAALAILAEEALDYVRTRACLHDDVYLQVKSRQVHWAGTGGYWVSASLDDVELIDA